MTTPDRIAAIRENLEGICGSNLNVPIDTQATQAYAFEVDALKILAQQALAHLDALEKEREELRAAVLDLSDIVETTREVSALRSWRYREQILDKHAATIAGCKQQGDGDEFDMEHELEKAHWCKDD